MATHLQEFTIHNYKGIHELKLSSLNSINILPGDNNCGKTNVLELLSTVENPQYTNSWILCTRMQNIPSRNRLYYNGFYHMFSINNNEKIISYEYIDKDSNSNHIVLKADFETMQISERKMYKINGFHRTENQKNDNER